VQENIDFVRENIDFGIWGMLLYTLIVIASIVFAPVAVMPLMPLASGLWGWQITALLSIVGWTIGAAIAFGIARKYGKKLIKKIVSLNEIEEFEKRIPKKNIFLTIVFLRMTVPVDGLSYLFGLFSRISFKTYILATIIGITPFSIAFSYAGGISIVWQGAALAIALGILFVGIWVAGRGK